MKLQKLVYYAYGWWLAYNKHPIISEAPKVWQHGPVFNSLYHVLKPFGGAPIRTTESDSPFHPAPKIDRDDEEGMQLVRWVWRRYGAYSSFDLSEMTHSSGTPWRRMAEAHHWRLPRDTAIPDDCIQDAFRREARELDISFSLGQIV